MHLNEGAGISIAYVIIDLLAQAQANDTDIGGAVLDAMAFRLNNAASPD